MSSAIYILSTPLISSGSDEVLVRLTKRALLLLGGQRVFFAHNLSPDSGTPRLARAQMRPALEVTPHWALPRGTSPTRCRAFWRHRAPRVGWCN